MRETPSNMPMPDMVTIDTIVFNMGGGAVKPPSPQIINFLKYPGSEKVKSCVSNISSRLNSNW